MRSTKKRKAKYEKAESEVPKSEKRKAKYRKAKSEKRFNGLFGTPPCSKMSRLRLPPRHDRRLWRKVRLARCAAYP
jgi:hypothetical protein